ncbi:MAG: putative membrane protein YedE/YeeE [Myxococcota bacterium]|jgi:uncharacterized membrane protein YedE/YeeE
MSKTQKGLLFLVLGALFGFLLSRAGATDPGYYAGLFLFQDLQLMWVIAAAAGTGAIGIALMKTTKARTLLTRQPIEFVPKPMRPGLMTGSVIFGAGWGLSAACPGTALAMVGEGRMGAVFVIAGILLGTYLYGWQESRRMRAAQVASDYPTSGTDIPTPSASARS